MRTLSEKAKENRRQELEAHGDNNEGDATDIDWDLDTSSKDDKEGLVDCIGLENWLTTSYQSLRHYQNHMNVKIQGNLLMQTLRYCLHT